MTKPKRVTCLHTAASNIPIFDAASAGLDLALHHIVRTDLLAAAEQAGGIDAKLGAATDMALRAAAADADVVLLTCSTLGPVADGLSNAVAVMRVDQALAEAAMRQGGRVAILCAAPTTLQATEDLFRAAARGSRAMIDIELVPGAWDVFKSGDQSRYCGMIAEFADRAFEKGAATVALAQASMAPAADRCRQGIPLTSPRAGLLAALVHS